MKSTRVRLTRLVALAALVTLLMPASAAAQRFKWWQADQFQQELGLTREQVDRLEEVFQSFLPTLRRQKDVLDRAEADFNRLVARRDHAATLRQVEVVEAARAELNKSRAFQLVNMRRVLTADQHAKLTALLAAQRERDARAGIHNH